MPEKEESAIAETEPHVSVIGSLSFVDRYLSVWIISAMIIGVVVGFYSPITQEGLSRINGAIEDICTSKIAVIEFI